MAAAVAAPAGTVIVPSATPVRVGLTGLATIDADQEPPSTLMSAQITSVRAEPPPAVSAMVCVVREPITARVPSPQLTIAAHGPIAMVRPLCAVSVGGAPTMPSAQ